MNRHSMKAVATQLLVVGAGLVMPAAHAALVTYGGQAATDGSGLTSSLVPANNVVSPLSGYFIETFDPSTSMAGLLPGITTSPVGDPNVQIVSNGCSINSYNAVTITTTGGGFAVQQGSTDSVAASPAGDTTCFGFGPRPGGGTPASIRVDYSNLLASLGPGVKISYLGLFYGSIDDYNNIAFFNGNTAITGSGPLANDNIISGLEVRQANGGPGNAGSWTSANSNVYINLFFDPNETFNAFEFRTTGVAFELDNIVVGVTRVPEPGTALLLGAALLGAWVVRRRRAGADAGADSALT